MTMRDLSILTAHCLIVTDNELKSGKLTPVEWQNTHNRIYQAVLVYYDQAEGLAEKVWAAAGKIVLRYNLYKEDIPGQAIERAVMALNKDNPPFDVWLILTCTYGKEAKD